ncbi:MAG TPA: SEC59/DGK1/VTE5 family protein [bacterium]|nr:SEC59/DGK1/VTE5 family protein [bacterium]
MTNATSAAQLDYRGEVWRKLLHLFALVMPVGYHLAPRAMAVGVTFFFFGLSLLVDIARFRGWPIQRIWAPIVNPIVRPKEAAAFTGATHILFSGWLCPLVFSVPAAALGMSTIILGDAAAALVGRRWGRHRFENGSRSWEGSTAFLLASLIPAFLIPGLPLWIGLIAAPLATVTEAISECVDDNLSVPLVVGLFAHLALTLSP